MTDRPAEPRRAVPMRVQRDLALQLAADLMRKLGMVPVDVAVEFELDHTPALCLREINPTTGEHIPHQHDPSYLIWRTKEAHAVKTHGPGGEKRITTAGSDRHARRKADRLAEADAEHRLTIAKASEAVAEPEPVTRPPARPLGGGRPLERGKPLPGASPAHRATSPLKKPLPPHRGLYTSENA